jgi:Mn2+/Fe2+ NRAMP family transporter
VVLVVLLTSDKRVMRDRVNGRGAKILGWTCAAVMSVAAVALLVT